MAWIELHQEVFRHPKVLRVAAALKVSNEAVVGHVAALWCWALDAKPDGGPLAELDVRAGANWTGRGDIAAALLSAGLLDEHDGGYWLHDWDEYAGRLIRQRRQAKERARNARAAYAQRTRTVREPFAPTIQNTTEQYTTEPSVSLTAQQEELRADLHGKARDRIFGGVDAPGDDWCIDLIQRGATTTDIDYATDASRRKGLNYCRTVLMRRVQERESGNDPDRVPERAAGASAGGNDYQASRKGRMARGGQRSESFEDFDDAPPGSIRAGGGDLPDAGQAQGVAGGSKISSFPGRDRAGGGAR